MPNPIEPHPADFRRAPDGLDISQPNHPFFRRIGRRCLDLIRPLALPFLERLQARVSSGVDASSSAQILQQVFSAVQTVDQKVDSQVLSAVQTLIDRRVDSQVLAAVQMLDRKVDSQVLAAVQMLDRKVDCQVLSAVQMLDRKIDSLTPSVNKTKEFSAALALLLGHCRDRITLVDVGARWGAHERWDPLANVADIVCFEPDRQECERLEASKAPNTRYLPIGLSDSSGERDLFVTVDPACSSNFEPVPALYEHYGIEMLRPLRKIKMPCRRLDDVLADHGISEVAGLKLDTQGSELSILHGAERALAKCSLVDVEVEFNPCYQQQALFCDVDRFLRERGFVLWRLENLFHFATERLPAAETIMTIAGPTHPTVARVPNGQVFWAQAQYVRSEYPRTGVDYMEFGKAIVPAILAGTYGWWDLALELVRKTGDRTLADDLRTTLAL